MCCTAAQGDRLSRPGSPRIAIHRKAPSRHERAGQHTTGDVGIMAGAAVRRLAGITREARARGDTTAGVRQVDAERWRRRAAAHTGEAARWAVKVELRGPLLAGRADLAAVGRGRPALLA